MYVVRHVTSGNEFENEVECSYELRGSAENLGHEMAGSRGLATVNLRLGWIGLGLHNSMCTRRYERFGERNFHVPFLSTKYT